MSQYYGKVTYRINCFLLNCKAGITMIPEGFAIDRENTLGPEAEIFNSSLISKDGFYV